MKALFPSHMNLVGKVMDLRIQRQNVVMANLANIETPNYKAKHLEFEEDLQAALNLDARGKLSSTNQEHMPAVFKAGDFQGDLEGEFRPHLIHGDDAVDLDKEMAEMSKNSMMYNALTTVIKKSMDDLSSIISEAQK